MLTALALHPAAALADGPVTPTAVDYRATVASAPAGLDARIVDGYLTFWLQVRGGERVTVLDYRGAPWVRYDRAGVSVNTNSEEYYLSQLPVPATPPATLTARTPPHWRQVSGGHAYKWRDGRLHAFASVALAPGQREVGSWRIPVVVDGRRTWISGTIFHRGPPSLVWFWPIAVLIACAVAAWRVRDERLDRRLGRGLAAVLLIAIGVAGAARYLHGTPEVTAGELLALAAILIAVVAGGWRVASGRSGSPLLFAVALGSLWAGLTLSPALVHGYVLLALPGFVVRSAAVVLLGGGASLILLAIRAVDAGTRRTRDPRGAAHVAA